MTKLPFWLTSTDLFLKSQGKSQSRVHRRHFGAGEHREPLSQRILGNGYHGVEVSDTVSRHSVFGAERNLDGDAANTDCDWRDGDEPAHLVGFIMRKEDHRAAASWPRELSPPDLAPLHSQGSAARPLADAALAASTSSVVSGWLEYPRT
jgi:hypothetical protein